MVGKTWMMIITNSQWIASLKKMGDKTIASDVYEFMNNITNDLITFLKTGYLVYSYLVILQILKTVLWPSPFTYLSGLKKN